MTHVPLFVFKVYCSFMVLFMAVLAMCKRCARIKKHKRTASIIVSLIHALILVLAPLPVRDTVCVALGYFCYDSWLMFAGVTAWQWETLFHHAVASALCVCGLFVADDPAMVPHIWAVIQTETSTIFLNASWIALVLNKHTYAAVFFTIFTALFVYFRVFRLAVVIIDVYAEGQTLGAAILAGLFGVQVFWLPRILAKLKSVITTQQQ
jgi:hypothetical protein